MADEKELRDGRVAATNQFLATVTEAGSVFAVTLREQYDAKSTVAIVCNALMGFVAQFAMASGINRATLDAVTTRAFDVTYLSSQPLKAPVGDA